MMKKIFFSIMIANSVILSAQTDLTSFFNKRDSIIQSKIGQSFLPFIATSIDGDTISNKDLIGKITLINFWFGTCTPCIAEFDELTNLHDKFKDNSSFQFLSFSSDPIKIAQEAVQKYKLPYIVYSIPREECYRLNFNSGFPTNILVDKNGKIILLKTGGSTKKERIEEDIKKFKWKIQEMLDQQQ